MSEQMTFAKAHEYSKYCRETFDGSYILQADEDIHIADLEKVAEEYSRKAKAHKNNADAVEKRVTALYSALEGEKFTKTIDTLLLSKKHEFALAEAWEMKATIIHRDIIPFIQEHSAKVEREYYSMLDKIALKKEERGLSQNAVATEIKNIVNESRIHFGELGNHFHTEMPCLLDSLSTGSAAPPIIPSLPPETIGSAPYSVNGKSPQSPSTSGLATSTPLNVVHANEPSVLENFPHSNNDSLADQPTGIEIAAAGSDTAGLDTGMNIGNNNANPSSTTQTSLGSSYGPNWISSATTARFSAVSGGSAPLKSFFGSSVGSVVSAQYQPAAFLAASTPGQLSTSLGAKGTALPQAKLPEKFNFTAHAPSPMQSKILVDELMQDDPVVGLAQMLLASIRAQIYRETNTPNREIRPFTMAVSVMRAPTEKLFFFFYTEQGYAYVQLPIRLTAPLLNPFTVCREAEFLTAAAGIDPVSQARLHAHYVPDWDCLAIVSSQNNKENIQKTQSCNTPPIIYQSDELLHALVAVNSVYGFPAVLFECTISPLELINPALYIQLCNWESYLTWSDDIAQVLCGRLMDFLIDRGLSQCAEVRLRIQMILQQEIKETAVLMIREIAQELYTAAADNLARSFSNNVETGISTPLADIRQKNPQKYHMQSILCVVYEFLFRAYTPQGVQDLPECVYVMLNCGMPKETIISQIRSL